MSKVYKIVLVRNAQSKVSGTSVFANTNKRILSCTGKKEAMLAGEILASLDGYRVDLIYTSLYLRSRRTVDIMLKQLGQPNAQVILSWCLCSSKYGNRASLLAFIDYPPQLKNQIYTDISLISAQCTLESQIRKKYCRYAEIEDSVKNKKQNKKMHENDTFLEGTSKRTIYYWNTTIVPQIRDGKNILVVAPRDNIMSIIKYLDNLTNAEVFNLYIPKGVPICYQLDENMRPVKFDEKADFTK